MKISIFIPMRKGSVRVPNKNVKDFAGIKGGLFVLKLIQMLDVSKNNNIHEIIISTDDKNIIEIANEYKKKYQWDKLKVIIRPDYLCTSETSVKDLTNYVADIVTGDHIMWLHITAPFVTADTYLKALDTYIKNINSTIDTDNYKNNIKEDISLLSVTEIRQFLIDWDLKALNHNFSEGDWPRTQDLYPTYEVNHAFYINSRANYKKYSNRVSPNFRIYILNKIEAFDIDTHDDFFIAECIYEKLNK